MRLTRGSMSLVMALLFSASAYAGRPERDYAKSLEAPIKEAADTVKAACGCSPAIKVDWESFKTAEDMSSIGSAIGTYKTDTEETCKNDKEGKAAFCKQVKTVAVKFTASEATTVCASGTCTFNIGAHQVFGAQYEKFLQSL
jgi:hypothetical protein